VTISAKMVIVITFTQMGHHASFADLSITTTAQNILNNRSSICSQGHVEV